VHGPRGLDGVRLAAAHLEAVVRDGALDEQPEGLSSERLKEEYTAQCRRRSSTRDLEVPRAGEDDTALHDVVV